MVNHRHSRREFLSLTGAGIAGMVSGPWLGAAAAAETQDADLVVFNAKVYTVDSRAPKAEAFAVKAGRFVAVGSTADIKALIGKGTQTFDAKQMTDRARVHRLPQSCARQRIALRCPGRQSLRGRVCDHRQHRRQTPRESARDTAGHLGRGIFLRRHQGEGQSPAQRSRPRPGVEGPPGRGPSSRRPHLVLQQQGPRDGGHQQEHAQSAGRNLRPRCERRSQRPGYRPGDGTRSTRSASGRPLPRNRRCSATAMGWPTSPSSSSAMA